jgi:hypothetical protein
MPFLMSYWEIEHPHQLVFHQPLPEDVEVRGLMEMARWAIPVMVRTTRFPMTDALYPLQAKQFIERVCREVTTSGLVVWCWDKWGSDPKIRLAFFRSNALKLLGLGDLSKPEWLVEMEELDRLSQPTIWERLDDEVV